MIDKKLIGKRIFDLRVDNNLTQDEFAQKLEIKRSAISQIENGIIAPSLEVIIKICTNFNTHFDWIILGEPDGFLKHISVVSGYSKKLSETESSNIHIMPSNNEETIKLLKSIIKQKESDIESSSKMIKRLEQQIESNQLELEAIKKLLALLEK